MAQPIQAPQPYYPQIDKGVDPRVTVHLQRIYPALNDFNAAIIKLKSQMTEPITKISTTTANTVTTIVNSVFSFQGLGKVNNETGSTSYTVQNSDNGIMLIVDDASPVSVSLNSVVLTPYFLFITNFGAGTATLTPTSGTINGVASFALPQNYTSILVFDGTNWWATALLVEPQNTPAVIHEWLASYNSSTGAFTATQPAFTDISGTVAISQGGTNATSAAAGTIPNATSGTASSWTATPTLGISGTTQGTLTLDSATAGGAYKIAAPANASTPTLTLPTTTNVLAGQFAGDGTVLSSTLATASAAGTLTASLANAGAGTVLGNSSSSPATPSYTSTPTLGKSGVLGSLTMGNATSGTVTLQPVTGALGTVTASLPANTGTIAETNYAQTWSATQTFNNIAAATANTYAIGASGVGFTGIYLQGGATFTVEVISGAQTGNYTLTIPVLSANDTIVTLGTSQTISGAKTFSSVITSTVTTGTAPFTVSSTTQVSNLNASQVGGKSITGSGAAIPTGPTSSTSGDIVTFTGTSGQIADSGVALTAVSTVSYHSVTSSSYSATATDRIIGVNFAGAVAITLISAASVAAGTVVTVKDESGSAATNNITVSPQGGQTIEGAASQVLNANYDVRRMYSNGSTKWFLC